jgi:hypothetical protein
MTYIAPPVHTLADFQIEYNGLLMGNGTPYYLPPDGSWAFFDMAAVKTMDQARTWADGSWSGPDFADVALPSVNFHVDAADPVTFANLVAAFWQAFGPQAVSQPLWVKLPNMPVRGVAAKAHKRVLPATNIWSTHAEGALQWRCPDPAWQTASRSLVLTGGGAGASGMVFPLFTQASPPVARTNLVTNPNFETDVSGWVAENGAALTRDTVSPIAGSASGKLTGATSGGGDIYSTFAVTAGSTVTFSMSYTTVGTITGTPKMSLILPGAATASQVLPLTQVSPGRFSVTATAVSSGTAFVSVTAGAAIGDVLHIDAVLAEVAPTMGAYFDGSTAPAGGYTYAWSGTVNESTSTASPAPVLDFGVTGVGSASGTLTNVGNTPAWPVVVITQPGSIIIDGFVVTYAQAIPAGQTVTIDYKAGTATLTGDIDRTTQLTVRQFSPVTSTSSVFFSAASGTATLTIADIWR